MHVHLYSFIYIYIYICIIYIYIHIYIYIYIYIYIIYVLVAFTQRRQCKYLVHKDIEKRETLSARCLRLNPYLSEGRQNRHEGSLSTKPLMTLRGTFAGKLYIGGARERKGITSLARKSSLSLFPLELTLESVIQLLTVGSIRLI